MTTPLRVLIVDDSAFTRLSLASRLGEDPEIRIAGTASDGFEALRKIAALKPDVVTLDIEMPGMDGITTLQRIMAECPTPVVIVSSYTQRGTRTAIRALMHGAVDVVAKTGPGQQPGDFLDELGAKLKAAPLGWRASLTAPPAAVKSPDALLHLQSFRRGDPVIVIGASTGGPRALAALLAAFPAGFPAAFLVVQHMPAGFTRSLAQRLNESCALTVQEASEGDRLARGLVLLAPGDYHMQVQGQRVLLDQGARRNHVRPSADVTMESAVASHGAAVIGVVLTGLGNDGTAGAGVIKTAGGRVIAEHASTSVVYGMPRGVVEAGLADRVVPLPEIARALMELVPNGNVGI